MAALRMSLNSPTEAEEQQELFKQIALKAHKYPELELIYHIPNGAFLGAGHLRSGWLLKLMGVKPGVPDIHCPSPRGSYGSLYIEMKRLKASPSDTKPEQLEWHRRLRGTGHRVEVCKGWRDAWNCLCEYLGLEGESVQ